jgi:prepilin-type processing-associated H-X9-DG protein
LLFRSKLVENGYNTTYCQIWTMARTDLLPVNARKGIDPDDPLDPANAIGVLSQRELERLDDARVALLADAAVMPEFGEEYTAVITRGPKNTSTTTSIHDFSHIGLVHGGGKQFGANILFADGHVDFLVDENADSIFDDKELDTVLIQYGLRNRASILHRP